MKNVWLFLAGILSADLDAVAASDITVISFGRADQAALTQAYYRPFRKSTGIDVRSASYDGQTTEQEQRLHPRRHLRLRRRHLHLKTFLPLYGRQPATVEL